jgi:DUF2933 family protein
MNEQNTHSSQVKKNNLVMWVFLVFIAYFLVTEHWAHIVPYLPFIILLLCPFMHIFMHGGHGHGGHDDHDPHENHSHHEEK